MLAQKQKALDLFNQKLLKSPISKQIAKVFLFGSTARGTESQESDIDLLVFTFCDADRANKYINKISYDILSQKAEVIEPIIYHWQNFLHPNSYFVYYNSRRGGKEIYTMNQKQLKILEAQGFVNLARHFLKSAQVNKKLGGLRIVADFGYHSIELLLKALLCGKMDELPRKHSGIIKKFDQFYIKTGQFRSGLRSELLKALKLSNEARYNPLAEIGQAEASAVISLAQDLLKISEKHFQ